MARKRMIVEIGIGTDLTGADYTKAAIRALKDALWHNSLTIALAVGQKLRVLQAWRFNPSCGNFRET